MLWLLSCWGTFAKVEKEIQTKKRVIIRKFDSSIFDEIKLVFAKGARLFDKTIGDKNIVKLLGLSVQ